MFCLAYLDNILIYTKGTLEEHKEQVRKVLIKLEARKLTLKLKKCAWHKTEVKFLGHIMSRTGITMDLGKIKDVQNWPTPTNKWEVQSFLGLVNYY